MPPRKKRGQRVQHVFKRVREQGSERVPGEGVPQVLPELSSTCADDALSYVQCVSVCVCVHRLNLPPNDEETRSYVVAPLGNADSCRRGMPLIGISSEIRPSYNLDAFTAHAPLFTSLLFASLLHNKFLCYHKQYCSTDIKVIFDDLMIDRGTTVYCVNMQILQF